MIRLPLAADSRAAIASRPLANGPLASLTRTGLDKLFHGWLGASGRRYICSVHALGDAPAFDCRRAVIVAVRRDGGGAAFLFAFSPCADEAADDLRFWTRRARACGANEWHVHLLAETAEERALVLDDLAPGRRRPA
jgi:hypothetical protein